MLNAFIKDIPHSDKYPAQVSPLPFSDMHQQMGSSLRMKSNPVKQIQTSWV